MQSAYWIQSDIQYPTSESHTMVHYSSDTSYTRIEYPSADPYSTYTMYNPADVRWDVLNDIMSSYNLHNYQILGLNGVRATCCSPLRIISSIHNTNAWQHALANKTFTRNMPHACFLESE